MEKKVPQVLQGDLDRLALQVPEGGLLRVSFLSRVRLEIKDLLAPMAQEEHPGLQGPLGVLTSCEGIQVMTVSQGLPVPRAHQALPDRKASQDVMGSLARKDQWDSRGRRGHMDFLGHLERRVYLALQADKDPLVLQDSEVNKGPLQIWKPAPESLGFLGYQAHEDQKDPWGSPE